MNQLIATMLLSAMLSPAADPAAPGPAPSRQAVEWDVAAMLWWTKSAALPPLVTTSDPADLGLLGGASTRVLVGQNPVYFPPRGGLRAAGRAVSESGFGAEAGGFFLTPRTQTYSAGPFAVLAVPTIDPSSGADTAVRLAAPDAASGAATLEVSTRLWGLDANALCRVGDGVAWSADLFAGLRTLQLSESLALHTTTTTPLPGLFAGQLTPANSTYAGVDSFSTRNQFYGAQVGTRVWVDIGGGCSLQTRAQLAFGTTQRQVTVDGQTILFAPGQPPQTAPGNVFTQTTNIGRYTRDSFTYVPQVGVAYVQQLNDGVRLTIGYDFLYWSRVARPADQIDRVVNPSLVPIQDDGTRLGPGSPVPLFATTDFWVHGFSLGLELTF